MPTSPRFDRFEPARTPPPVDVLLAEEHPGEVALILESLQWPPGEPADGRVHVVHDGATALDFLLCRNAYADRAFLPAPRLILMEVELPIIGGLEVLRVVKETPRTRAIPPS